MASTPEELAPATPAAVATEEEMDLIMQDLGLAEKSLDIPAMAASAVGGKQAEANQDDDIKYWEEQARKGVDMRTNIGQKFSRAPEGGASEEYRKLRSHAEAKLKVMKEADRRRRRSLRLTLRRANTCHSM